MMTDATWDYVTWEMQNGVVRLTLNRPDTLNAYSAQMHAALMDALHRAEEAPEARVVLITGTGRGFCAGQNLRDRDPRKMTAPLDLSVNVEKTYNAIVRRVRGFDKPVVCAVNGVAAGAGVGLALACDMTIVAEDAPISIGFARIGLVPDAGTSWVLTRRLGEARAMGLALTGGTLTGREAADAGLVWQAVPSDNLGDAAMTLAMRLAEGPRLAQALTRRMIRAATEQTLEEQLGTEARAQGQAGRHPDYAEGVLAFLEKRKARFAQDDAGQGDDDKEPLT